MNWRRGLLLAGIHLVVAVPLLYLIEARDAVIMIDHHAPGARLVDPPASAQPSGQEEQTIFLDPCEAIVDYPPSEQVLRFANLPAFALTGWRFDCPARWSLSAGLHVNYFWAPTASEMAIWRRVDLLFLLLIPLQWFLVGGFPLRQARRPWGEPGALITVCTVVAAVFVFIPSMDRVSQIPALIAALAWLWWFSLLVWTGLRSGWRLIRQRKAQAV